MRNRLTLPIIALLCAPAASATAQQALNRIVIQPAQETQSERRQQRKQFLTELIEAIDEEFELTDKQLQRLRVACKGAVEYSLENEGDRASQGQWFALPRRGAAVQGGRIRVTIGGHDSAAAEHPIWTKTLERMFTAEERAKIKSLEQEQLKRLDPRLRALNRLHVRRLQEVKPGVIELRAFRRDNADKVLIHPVWPQPIKAQNRRN